MATALAVSSDLDKLTFRGSTIYRMLGDAVTEATIEMTTDQVSQLTLSLEDPGFAVLNRGILNNGIYVDYQELRMQIASTETGAGVAGVGGCTVQIRPVAVQRLKARKGKLVMKNLSPSQFVAAECQKVGVKYVTQPSARRKLISRDIPDKSNAGVQTDPPSTWTTFTRLAQELGFSLFEVAGTIYFGTPSWIASIGTRVYAAYRYGDRKYWVDNPPTCRRSIDSAGVVTISLDVPAYRAAEFRPGRVLVFRGVPTFNGAYLITSVSYSLLAMDQTITVEASTPTNLLTQAAVPITKNVAYPTTITTGLISNIQTIPQAVAEITEPRRNTKSRNDLVYWVRQSVLDTYAVDDDKGRTSINGTGNFDGTDLLNYGLFQVGMSLFGSMSDVLRACVASGTKLDIDTALRTPGAILFAGDYMAISTQIKDQTIEPLGRVYVEIKNVYNSSRFNAAYLLPGMIP